MAAARTVIAFDKGDLPPAGTYSFELDLSGENGCDIIQDLTWLVQSLKEPYEIHANARPISPDEIGTHFKRLTVWTNDRSNADFLLLLSELGVQVVRAIPGQVAADQP